MVSLIAKSPLDGLVPVTTGGAVLAALDLGRVTSVAPFRGQVAALGKALKGMGLGWPGPGESFRSGAALVVWSGAEQALLCGADPSPLSGLAALTDQSDGWATLALTGPQAEAVLARLVPLDLRIGAFPPGRVARTSLFHAPLLIWRREEGFGLMVFRSMAGTAVHELETAMKGVAARG